MTKRAFDIIVSLMLMALVSPVFVLLVILILVRDGRPVFFTQTRPGLNAEPFLLFKFRTMSIARGNDGQLLSDEKRLTKFGSIMRRLSLDEIPQLINVIKGDMSLIGPRPLLMEYISLYNERQSKRHNARPGITGWAQVRGRNSLSWEEKFNYDVWYVENQSFMLDLKILWLTFKTILLRQGVSHAGHVTMPKFTGTNRRNDV